MIAGKFEIIRTVELILTSSMAAEKELKLELHQIEPFTLTPAKFVAILISIIFIFNCRGGNGAGRPLTNVTERADSFSL